MHWSLVPAFIHVAAPAVPWKRLRPVAVKLRCRTPAILHGDIMFGEFCQVGPSKMVDMWPKFEEKMKKEPDVVNHHNLIQPALGRWTGRNGPPTNPCRPLPVWPLEQSHCWMLLGEMGLRPHIPRENASNQQSVGSESRVPPMCPTLDGTGISRSGSTEVGVSQSREFFASPSFVGASGVCPFRRA